MRLQGRNAKTLWTSEWEDAADRAQLRRSICLLQESFEGYERAFEEDLNHYYSGLNALAMLTIQTELAELLPELGPGVSTTTKART